MVKDRLQELNKRAKEYSKVPTKEKSSKEKMAPDSNKGIQNFLHDVQQIETNLQAVKEKVDKMKNLQLQILSSPFPDVHKQKYEELVDTIRKDSSKIRKSLKNIENQIEENPASENGALNRIRSEQTNRLTLSLAQTTNDFFTAQSEYMEKTKQLLKKQFEITNRHDAELEEILDSEQDFKVFTLDYISSTKEAEEQLQIIEERDKEIKSLEKNISHMNQLFIDMNLLVASQGETIVQIEKQTDKAVEEVGGGKVQLKKAKEMRVRSRKRCWCFIGIGIIAALIVAAVIAGIIVG